MDKEKRRARQLKKIAQMRIFDDTLMSAVFDDQTEETAYLINTVLGRDDIIVDSAKTQFFIANVYGHTVHLDVLAHDVSGTAYHAEVQREMAQSSVQRARFDAAMVDTTLLKRGEDYETLPDRYTIFITEKDKFEAGLPVYEAENKITQLDNRPLGDGGHIVYVNGEYQDTTTPIGQLMHDFMCVDPKDIINPLLRERVNMLKNTERGNDKVCKLMDEFVTEEIMEEKMDLARDEIARGELTLEQISRVLRLPLDIVKELAKEPA